MICDRCGVPRTYMTLKGTNGMVAWQCDLCASCYEDVKSMMLRQNNLYKERSDNPQ
jgi:hypothetical protein